MGRNNQQRRKAKAKAKAHARAAARERSASGGAAAQSGPGAFGQAWQGADGGAPTASRIRWAQDAERSLSWLRRWVHLRSEGRHSAAEEAELELRALVASRPQLAQLTALLVGRLAEQVEWAWQHGWEPADLLRQVTRELGPGAVVVAKDVVASSVSRFAAATVSPRWHDQLRSLQAQVWWPTTDDHLIARTSGAEVDVEVLADAVAVLDLLVQIPALEQIDTPPGRWRAPTSPSPQVGPRVSARLLERVRALLAQAESTPYEAEAETFTAAAQSLMARHSIDQALLARAAPGDRASTPVARRVGVDRPYEAPKASLLDAVASANRCRTVWSKHLGFSTVVGFASDLEAVETLYTSLLLQATHALTGHGSRSTRGGGSRTRSFRQSFLLAYASRIGQRLREATDSEVDHARAAETTRVRSRPGHRPGPGTDLVAVLADRSREVDDAVQSLFPEVVRRTTRSVPDLEGWAAGTYAADNATLFSGQAVGGS